MIPAVPPRPRHTLPLALRFQPTQAYAGLGHRAGHGGRLGGAGLDVVVTYHRDEREATDTAAEVEWQGRKAVVDGLDTTDLEHVGDVVDDLAGRLGGVDVFVSNAARATAPRCWR